MHMRADENQFDPQRRTKCCTGKQRRHCPTIRLSLIYYQLLFIISALRPHRVGRNALMVVVCLSVCLSRVWPSVENGRAYNKLKIGRKEVHDTDDPWLHLEVERSKIKVTRPLDAVTENQP